MSARFALFLGAIVVLVPIAVLGTVCYKRRRAPSLFLALVTVFLVTYSLVTINHKAGNDEWQQWLHNMRSDQVSSIRIDGEQILDSACITRIIESLNRSTPYYCNHCGTPTRHVMDLNLTDGTTRNLVFRKHADGTILDLSSNADGGWAYGHMLAPGLDGIVRSCGEPKKQ